MSGDHTPARLLERVMDLGAREAEVFWKEGRTVRLHRMGRGPVTESLVEERGVAIRAWGRNGGMAFSSFVPDFPAVAGEVLQRLAGRLDRAGDGAPGLPSAPPPGPDTRAPFDRRLDGLFRAARDGIDRAGQAFDRKGLEGLRFEGAWCEAGGSRIRLVNSRGFDGTRQSLGWNLAMAARHLGGGGRDGRPRVGYLAFGGRSPEGIEPEALARELAWRVASPAGGPPARAGREAVLIDASIASTLLRSLAPLLVASEESAAALREGRRFGPSCLSIREAVDPGDGPWDGEGVACREVDLVDRGRLVGLLSDLDSARRYGVPRTGSARRTSFRDRPAAGPSRLVLSGGDDVDGTALLERLRPGLCLTTGRVLAAETGPGGAITGGGFRVDERGAASPVGAVVLRGGAAGLIGRLRAVSRAGGIGSRGPGAECGSILLVADAGPA